MMCKTPVLLLPGRGRGQIIERGGRLSKRLGHVTFSGRGFASTESAELFVQGLNLACPERFGRNCCDEHKVWTLLD